MRSPDGCHLVLGEPIVQVCPAYPDYLWRDANEWKAPACTPVADGPGFDAADIGGGGFVGEDVGFLLLINDVFCHDAR